MCRVIKAIGIGQKVRVKASPFANIIGLSGCVGEVVRVLTENGVTQVKVRFRRGLVISSYWFFPEEIEVVGKQQKAAE